MLVEDWLHCLALIFLRPDLHLLPPGHLQPRPHDLEVSGVEGELENCLSSGGLVRTDYCLERGGREGEEGGQKIKLHSKYFSFMRQEMQVRR